MSNDPTTTNTATTEPQPTTTVQEPATISVPKNEAEYRKAVQKLARLEKQNAFLINELVKARQAAQQLQQERNLILDRFSKNFNKFLEENALGDDEDEEEEEQEQQDVEAGKPRELVDELAEDAAQQESFSRVLAELAAHQPAEPIRVKNAASSGASSASGTAGKKRSRPAARSNRPAPVSSHGGRNGFTTSDDEPGSAAAGLSSEPARANHFVSIDEEDDDEGFETDPELAQLKKIRRSPSPANDLTGTPTKSEDSQVYKVIPVPFDADGNPQLPLSLNMITIHELGAVVHDRPAYHNKRYILPVGFHSSRSYLSCLDAGEGQQIVYHSRIIDNGPAPLFQVFPEGRPEMVFSSASSTGAWAAVAKAVAFMRGKDSAPSVSGPDYFGLSNPTVSMLIERLPGAQLCEQYAPKRYEVSSAVGGKSGKQAAVQKAEEVVIKATEPVSAPEVVEQPIIPAVEGASVTNDVSAVELPSIDAATTATTDAITTTTDATTTAADAATTATDAAY